MADNTFNIGGKKKSNYLMEGLRSTLALVVVCVIAAAAITLTQQHTSPIIAENEHIALMEMLDRLMPEAEAYELVSIDGHDVYLGIRGTKVFAAVVPWEKNGFWGNPLRILVLVGSEGSVRDVIIRGQGETPGIGSKVDSLEFLSQFKDKTLLASGRSFSLDEVDVVSGPMLLYPNYISTSAEQDKFDEAEAWDAMDCIQCGTCSYVCPAKRSNVNLVQKAKTEILVKRHQK